MRRISFALILTLFMFAPAAQAGNGSAQDYMDSYYRQGASVIDSQLDDAFCNGQHVDRILENLASPQNEPQSVLCYADNSGILCTMTNDLSFGVEGGIWSFIVYSNVKLKGHATAQTRLECSGTAEVDVFHYGGVGPRVARAGVVALPDESSTNGDDTIPPLMVTDGCSYIGPHGYCKNRIMVEGSSVKEFQGQVVSTSGNVAVCSNFLVGNFPSLRAASLLGTSDTFVGCASVPAPPPPTGYRVI